MCDQMYLHSRVAICRRIMGSRVKSSAYKDRWQWEPWGMVMGCEKICFRSSEKNNRMGGLQEPGKLLIKVSQAVAV